MAVSVYSCHSLVESLLENIPSLSPLNSLYITTSNNDLEASTKNVKVVGSPIYDDGFVVVFGNHDNFTRSDTYRNPNFNPTPKSRFYEGSLLLKSKGYLIMSLFLELQLFGFLKNSSPGLRLTVFAPDDGDCWVFLGFFPEYQQLFFRHLVLGVMYWNDLIDMVNRIEFKNYVIGLRLKITKVNDMSFVHGVEIMYPDLYYNDLLVVHGLQSLIPLPNEIDDEMDENPGKTVDIVAVYIASDRSEF